MVCKNTARLNCEALEVRDVPAIVVQGMVNQAFTQVTPNSGNVSIQEVAISPTALVFDQSLNNFLGGMVVKTGTENNNISLSNTAGLLTINDSDGVFVQFSDAGNPAFQMVGTSLKISGVTGVSVATQFGGNNTITDTTSGLGLAVNDGPGNDTVSLGGATLNPLLLQFLMKPGGLNPAFFPLLAGLGGPAKTVTGGSGNLTASVTGFAFGYTIAGGSGTNMINGPMFGEFNTLKGGSGNNTIIGGFGTDIIFGGTGTGGFDVLAGLGGHDYYILTQGRFALVLNQKGDTVIGDNPSAHLSAHP
jgi:Ca2+-binding RTX toxin-like protein